ncbi:MAG: glycosyl transferase family 2 [Legionellales bacterium]|nr:glycosyl transferase family 2 [Legionellales bacterium]|tara:strand:- start:244 stop:966 length:723 start_codon:yes stop_codon:yes gene_type:complete
MNRLDIIIPIFNEGENIKNLVVEFNKKLKMKYKIFICYDFDEESGLKYLDKSDEKLIFIKNTGRGPNEAIKSGIKSSSSEFIMVYMSDDFENIELINRMFELIKKDYDLIIPSRYVENGKFLNAKFYKKLITNWGSFLMYTISGVPYKDCTNAFKMFKRSILKNIDLVSKIGFTFAIELTIKAHYNQSRIIEIPCTWKDLPNRKSNFKVFRWLPFYTYWLFYSFFYRFIVLIKNSLKISK